MKSFDDEFVKWIFLGGKVETGKAHKYLSRPF